MLPHFIMRKSFSSSESNRVHLLHRRRLYHCATSTDSCIIIPCYIITVIIIISFQLLIKGQKSHRKRAQLFLRSKLVKSNLVVFDFGKSEKLAVFARWRQVESLFGMILSDSLQYFL